MEPDRDKMHTVRKRLGDEPSLLLYDGRASYCAFADMAELGASLAKYFAAAPSQLRNDCPELFSIMDKAQAESAAVKTDGLSSSQLRFYEGLGACPQPFTDLYNIYFDSGLISFGAHEVFVDGGALDLFNSYRFSKKCRGIYDAIYAFEPDRANYAECLSNKALFDERMRLFSFALGDAAACGAFCAGRQDAHLDDAGAEQVNVDTLDRLLSEVQPTLIKLHLEGGELAALRGAKNLIRRCAPTLAVCLDHRPGDIVDIPALLLEYVPDYVFYLRHYSTGITETVLYAVKE